MAYNDSRLCACTLHSDNSDCSYVIYVQLLCPLFIKHRLGKCTTTNCAHYFFLGTIGARLVVMRWLNESLVQCISYGTQETTV